MNSTIPFIPERDKGLDIGSDTGTGVDDCRPKLSPGNGKEPMEAQRNNEVGE